MNRTTRNRFLLGGLVLLLFVVGMVGASSLSESLDGPDAPPEPPPLAPDEAAVPPVVPGVAPESASATDGSDAGSAGEGKGSVRPAELPAGKTAPSLVPRTYERDGSLGGPGDPRAGNTPRFAPAGSSGGRSPGFRPMGRTKYAPVPEEPGKAVLEGVVKDRQGEPVSGAVVYRVKPDVDVTGSGPLSFAHVRRIASTGKDGTFRGNGPGGRYLVTANLKNLLNRRRGLDTGPGVMIEVAEEGTKSGIEIRLPFAVAELGRIEGRLLDPEGRPVRRVEVFVDYFRAWTKKDGRFTFDAVLPGKAQLTTRKTGFVGLEKEIEVGAGETVRLDIELALADGGSLILAGTVRDTDGDPVPNAYVYVMEPGRTIRSGSTDEEGVFEFRGLPDRLAEAGANVTIHAKGHISASRTAVPVPSSSLAFVLEKAVKAKLLFRNAGSGEPLVQYRLEFRRDLDGHPFKSATHYSKDGSYVTTLPAGKIYAFVEAPDMEPRSVELDLVPGEEVREFVVEMTPSPE